MPNPWDRPPIPNRGDESHDQIYTGVGLVMSYWEATEFELSRLYTWFGGELDDPGLMAEYGRGTIYRTRSESLHRKAEEYFRKNPDQKAEGEFQRIMTAANGFAGRRSDIAHSMSFRIDRITWFRERLKKQLLKRPHYALVPPLYAVRWASDAGYPLFAYTLIEMRRIGNRLNGLGDQIVAFRGGEPYTRGLAE